MTDDVAVLILGRALQGIGVAAIPLGISLVSVLMPRSRVGSSIALVSAMLGVGGAIGLPLAGLVAEHADFHVLFWVTGAPGWWPSSPSGQSCPSLLAASAVGSTWLVRCCWPPLWSACCYR